ncbi:protein ABA AND ROS SENSITIVE 1 [Typha angustifolia]|uniref:protein ABA AND ROS SENSITIVE 1 n=1 Tax=Typha angustifolia TaxID=59011 RepID=UPI003C308462
MDQRKALFRAKLRESAQKREKRIDSPLVRYNENDQPTCRVCNVTLKSESLWPAHQASRKHHEAIENLRAAAGGTTRRNNVNLDQPPEVHKTRPSSTLPADFFDKKETKRQKNDVGSEEKIHHVSSQIESNFLDHQNGGLEISPSAQLDVPDTVKEANELADTYPIETKNRLRDTTSTKLGQASRTIVGTDVKQVAGSLPHSFNNKEKSENQTAGQPSRTPGHIDNSEVKQVKKTLPDGFFDSQEKSDMMQSNQMNQAYGTSSFESKQAKGALPEGFFDNKDADLRARGIKLVKVDVNDAYKEFENEIQDDLKEVDDRLEEEEIDAAEEREEFLTLEQREYREKVDMVKQKLVEVKTARIARAKQKPAFMTKESSDESSSDEEDDDESFAVDWRAQHL